MQLELIAANLKRARQSLRLSQTTVGKEIGLPRQGVSALESGKRELTLAQLATLANLYRIRVESFFKPQQPSAAVPLPHVERRRNVAKSEKSLEDRDRAEIHLFIEDLKKSKSSAISGTILPTSRRAGIQPLSEIAERIRSEADLDLRTPPVNVYKALTCFGIRVRMTSLNSISGAFIPGGENWPPGVLVNSDQPSDRQRYSAAHELGHCVLGHARRGDAEIVSPLGRRFEAKEVEADSFAAEFLMPVSLIMAELKQLRQSDKLEEGVYRLADRFLVSYQAMIYRLAYLGVVSATQKETLLQLRPSEIEARLQLKVGHRQHFDPRVLESICAATKISPELLEDADGVRQLQELALEEYARSVPEAERADTAGTVYEKVALWVAKEYPLAPLT